MVLVSFGVVPISSDHNCKKKTTNLAPASYIFVHPPPLLLHNTAILPRYPSLLLCDHLRKSLPALRDQAKYFVRNFLSNRRHNVRRASERGREERECYAQEEKKSLRSGGQPLLLWRHAAGAAPLCVFGCLAVSGGVCRGCCCPATCVEARDNIRHIAKDKGPRNSSKWRKPRNIKADIICQ